MKIPFNVPAVTGKEIEYISQCLANKSLSGDGEFTGKCHQWFHDKIGCVKPLLTTSCTHALEMSAILAGICPGDQVIMPSFTFVSTANAFVLRGAEVVFIDIRPDTMNIDETLIKKAITKKTKVIVPVHYAGVACEMDEIMKIADEYGLLVVEDAAQGVMSTYRGRPLGSIGHMGCYSFHETKNYTCGEGGALILNAETLVERAEIIREKGTNRSKFMRGEIDKYSWIDLGSSYLPSELNAACLYAQLELAGEILADRMASWDLYFDELQPLAESGLIELQYVPEECEHNGIIFYIKAKDLKERSELINHLKKNGISAVFHYIPLHSSLAGRNFGRFSGEDIFTTTESERLLRLPLYYGMAKESVHRVALLIRRFYGE